MIKDLYNSQQKFEEWLNNVDKVGIEGLNKFNSNIIIRFIKDMKLGINISKRSEKGGRSFIRLNHLKQKIIFIAKQLEKRNIEEITKVKAQQLHELFSNMREGIIKTNQGMPYKSTGDYVKDFKVFWHWYQKINRIKGKEIIDITEELDRRGDKPEWVYFTELDLDKMIGQATYDLKPIIALAFDSGARPSELLNIKISDFSNDFKELSIREETSKTFGRKIKLMLCSRQLLEYSLKLNLKQDDYICRISLAIINQNLRKLGKLFLSDRIKKKNLSLYDFRHCSACYWLPKYKSESALKYRFGWKRSDMIHYYTEFLGMKDTIKQEDLYTDISKTELEKQIIEIQERMEVYERLVNKMYSTVYERNDKLSDKENNDNLTNSLKKIMSLKQLKGK